MHLRIGIVVGLVAACNGTTVSDDDGPSICGGYEDEPSPGSLTVRIRNDSALDIYLPGICGSLNYLFVPSDAEDEAVYRNRSGACMQSCAQLQREPQLACTADACASTAIRVPAGGSIDLVWDGTGLLSGLDMPEGCYRDPSNASQQCNQIVAAKPGEYRLDIVGYLECEGECVCQPDGTCMGDVAGQSAIPDQAVFQYPASGPVEVVFGVCAFGCADS